MSFPALLILAILAAPAAPVASAAAQGSIAILDARPEPQTLLHADLLELLSGSEPLVLQLSEELPSDLESATIIVLARGDAASADSRDLAERVRGADSLVLEGGTLLGWYKTLHLTHRPTRLVHALLRHVRDGGPLIGIGGGGAALAGAGIVLTAELDRVPRNPRRTHTHQARVALGWGPPALVDATAWGGEPMRTLRLMERSYMRVAAHLGPSSGLVYESRERSVRVIGDGPVVFFESDPGHRNRHDLRDGRVSLLARGDVWDIPNKRLLPAANTSSPSAVPTTPTPTTAPTQAVALPGLLRALAQDSDARELALKSPWGRLILRHTKDTRILSAAADARPLRAGFDLMDSP